jgi:ribonuclease III
MIDEGTEDPARRAEALAELESLLKYHFRDRKLLERSLTHRSFVNENEGQGLRHNESMEFLGDAVLGFVISARIFDRFPDCSEGDLSKIKAYLVSAVNLAHLASEIRLGDFLFLSRGEEKTGGRTKRAIVVDAYEALLGALYLDGGIEATAGFLERQLGTLLETLDGHHLSYGDFKSALQEQLHNMGKPEPVYRVVDEIGPDHRKVFVIEVIIGEQVIARSSGRTKKEAQQEAARLAIDNLKLPQERSEHPAEPRP